MPYFLTRMWRIPRLSSSHQQNGKIALNRRAATLTASPKNASARDTQPLIEYCGMICVQSKDVLSPPLLARTVEVFTALKPLFDFMNAAVLPSRRDSV